MRIYRVVLGTKRITGLSFWTAGYGICTVGLDEEMIKNEIREQDKSNHVLWACEMIALG